MARQYRKYVKEEVEAAVKECLCLSDVLRKLDRAPVGGNSTSLALLLKKWEIDTSHFTGQAHNRGKASSKRKSADEILAMGTSMDRRLEASKLRRCLDEKGVEYKCNCCGINEWMGKTLSLEVDHIDECYWNNTFENLQYLCPNCHTMKNR